MKIDSSGILCSAKIDSNKACYTFSSFVSLSNGSILATARGGNNKDSELEGIESVSYTHLTLPTTTPV